MRSAILLSSYFVDVRFDTGSKVTGDGAATIFFVWTGFSFNTIGWDAISSTKIPGKSSGHGGRAQEDGFKNVSLGVILL